MYMLIINLTLLACIYIYIFIYSVHCSAACIHSMQLLYILKYSILMIGVKVTKANGGCNNNTNLTLRVTM